MGRDFKILVINNGSTSLKIAGYINETELYEDNLTVDAEEIRKLNTFYDQAPIRKKAVEDFLDKRGESIADYDVIACRGNPAAKGVKLLSGGYAITPEYVDMCYHVTFPHVSAVGPIITYEWMKKYNIPGFIYDAEGTYEFNDFATLSGHKDFPIQPGSHTLNQKAVARKCAKMMGGNYEDYIIIVAHLGGGASVALHDHGKLVDSTSDGYSPERVGGISGIGVFEFLKACFSGKYTLNQFYKMFIGGGGLVSYLGTSDLREVEKRIEGGDKEAEFYFNGMVYGLAKEIGAMATVGCGKIDCIVLTGGLAYSKRLVQALRERISFIAPIEVFPGSFEMESLANGILRIMRGEEKANYLNYKSE